MLKFKIEDFNETIDEKDFGKVRVVDWGEKKIKFTSLDDPYGLWRIEYPKGNRVPDSIAGKYTSFSQAYDACANHITKMGGQLGETYRPDLKAKA